MRYISFNPRTRVGCDNRDINEQSTVVVSIHAPVWGATIGDIDLDMGFEFQSTHPCGVRPRICKPTIYCSSFNPRTRVGCDRYLWVMCFGH